MTKLYVLAFVLMLALFGCSEKSNNNKNQSLTIAWDSDITNFNPWVNNSINANDIFSLLYRPLFYEDVNWNKLSDFKPIWVRELSFSQDSLTLNLKLNNDIYWSDGVRSSAYDIEFSQKMLALDSTGIYFSSKQNISEVTVVDSFNLVVRYKKRSLYPIMDLNDGYILPVHIFRNKTLTEIKNDESFKSNPVTNGDFKIASHINNSEIKLIRSQNKNNNEEIQTIIFKIIPDPVVRLNLFKNGTVDILPNLPVNQMSALTDTSLYRISKSLYPSSEYIIFNLESRVFKKKENRELIAFHLDRKKITEIALGSEGTPLSTVFPNGFWVTDSPGQKIINQKPNKEQIAELNNANLTLKIASTNEPRVKAGYEIKKQLAEIGIQIKLELLPSDILAKEVRSGKYFMAIWGTREGTKPNLSLRYFKSSIGSSNLTRYADSEFERIHHLAMDEYDAAKSVAYWQELQKMLLDDNVIVPLFQRNKIDAFSTRISHSENNSRSILNNMDSWQIVSSNEK